ncbi:MAG TPA: rod shape-determining protein RodA [Bacteroidetes bacterium]|nr:rod shape-determining protein RodA [Bacteroidota bacterium]
MSLRKAIDRRGFDWITFAIYISLVIIGTISLYSVLYDKDNPYSFFSANTEMGRYVIFVILSLSAFLIVYLIEWKFWYTFSYPVYLLGILLLIGVLIFGSDIKGSRSWFNFFGFSFQPSEFAKFGTALAISSYLAHYKNNLRNLKNIGIAFLIILIPMLLILMQPDAGSALTFLSLLILFYRAGFSPLFYIISGILIATFITTLVYSPYLVSIAALILSFGIILLLYFKNKYWYLAYIILIGTGIYIFTHDFRIYAISGMILLLILVSVLHWLKNRENTIYLIPFTVLFIITLSFLTNYSFNNILKPHQQERINVWLNPEKCDPRGSLYNVLQSKMAIGSGGLTGKGFLKGAMTHLNFVPEQSTDFIFSSIGEEQGFIGVVSIIVLFLLLITRILIIAERGKTKFITYYGYALAGYIFIHFFMNIGMNMGIVPVVGIPLPFISKGGTSLLVFSIMMAVLLKMDAERNVR